MKQIFAYAFYPLLLLVSCLAYLLIFHYTNMPLAGTYAGVSTASIIIFTAEKLFPFHVEWIPSRNDLIEDLFFYSIVVQVFFPLLLFFIGVVILKSLGFENAIIFDLWPHNFPKVVQFLILALTGEFFQYWWHRLCHTVPVLWSIHATHHFPQKLYSWNTSRFHFLDKLVELIFTVFIFFAFGMGIEVFSYYYLFYAITGFIQHSNLDVKLGIFDYIIAGGETHRFHHDSNLQKSKCNYANNFVLFDLIFNTFKRNPREENIKVGAQSKDIPQNLSDEVKYPFIQMKKYFFKFMFKLAVNFVGRTILKDLMSATVDTKKTQQQLLFNILMKNETTAFGLEHNFKNINTIEDFKKMVPIRDYEEHRKYIEQIFKGELSVLGNIEPHYFTKTSGTTGLPKYIPVNIEAQKSYSNSQKLLTHSLFFLEPRFLDGEIFSVVGNAVEEILFEKWPCGSMSGKLYSTAHKSVKAKHVFQDEIALLNDSDQKYFYLAALAVLSPNVTFYVSPNPSTFLKIFEVINSKRNELINLIEIGNDTIIKSHSKQFSHALNLLKSPKGLMTNDVWPQLLTATMWMEGSCSFLIPNVKKMLDTKTNLVELGYLCSEFYGSVPIDLISNKHIPTILDNYFEFIEKNNYESGIRETMELYQLETGKEYYIIITTKGSFYRYFINDIVLVTGFYNSTPTIVFSQKGKGITNLVGEKISEKQLVSFFESLNKESFRIKFFICLADQIKQNYRLYLEYEDLAENITDLSEKLNIYLKKINIEYSSKVSDQRLMPIEIRVLQSGTSELYRNHCLKNGQRESQFKFLHLQYLKDVDFLFEELRKK